MNKVSRLVLLICLTSAVSGQTPEPIRDFPIGVGDLLELSVYGVPDFSRSIRVNSSGKIRLPFLGAIQAGGLTLSELEISLTDLLDPDYVKDPQVSIFAKEPRSRMFSILGAVKSPGKYQMLEPIKLVTAISEAGGLDLTRAGNEVIIQRVTPSTPESNETSPVQGEEELKPAMSVAIKIDLNKLLQQGDRSLDIPIEPGDMINIPEKIEQSFYIIGDVMQAGAFPYPDDKRMKLSLGVAMAGGPIKTAKLKDSILLRQMPDGTRQEIALRLDRILKGKAPDMDIQPNDLVFVPGSMGKTLAYRMLGVLPQTASRGIAR